MTKKEYVAHLLGLGIPKFVAKRMVKLLKTGYEGFDYRYFASATVTGCISSFALWSSTPEGWNFWSDMHDHLKRAEKQND